MKKIFYPVLLLVLAACKNPEQTSETIVPAPAIADIPTDTVTTQVDGITSATSKPNQVSFNGTIVLPPQRQATVALTMGGVVKHTSLLPGQQVRQGALLATLENPDFIALQQTYLDSHAQAEYLQAEYERQKTLSTEQAASEKSSQSQSDISVNEKQAGSYGSTAYPIGHRPEELAEKAAFSPCYR